MPEKGPRKEVIQPAELNFLWHPTSSDNFSGYGLTVQPGRKDSLVGLLMVDRPRPAAPAWLQEIEDTFGECQLAAITATGERGVVCQMQIEPDSRFYVRPLPLDFTPAITQVLSPLLEQPPKPCFNLRWDAERHLWTSELVLPNQLPPELREVFERTGSGCAAAETNIGVVYVCHAADRDIAGFTNKPVWHRWELALMPTAPVIRLNAAIVDDPQNPYRFESFLNIGDDDQDRILEILLTQEQLYFPFHGDDFGYRFTKVVPHDADQRAQLGKLVGQAFEHWQSIPAEQRDFDRAKIEFQWRFPLQIPID